MDKEKEVAVYIHIPFCLRKCNYCDFYSVKIEEDRAREFALALLEEIRLHSSIKGKTLYLGGGTPTSLPSLLLREIITTAKERFSLPLDAELSVEANPETLDEEKLKLLRSIGVNRLSIGVQSFNDELLKFLGRAHSASRARWAVEKAKELSFENINIDLLFAIPGQSLDDWHRTLEETLHLKLAHISCYSLTLEKGTKLWRDFRDGKIEPVDEELSAQMFEDADKMLTSAGYIHYEISNYALPGYHCKHNLCYWRGEPYLGLGPSAVSFLPPFRLRNPSLPSYLKGKRARVEEMIDERESEKEKVMLGLRLKEGIEKRLLKKNSLLEEMLSNGLIEEDAERIRLTTRGMLVYNSIVSNLI